MGFIEAVHCDGKPYADVLMLKIILGAHDQFAVDEFMDKPVVRQALKLFFRPLFFCNARCYAHSITV